jgi:hypothetical protein
MSGRPPDGRDRKVLRAAALDMHRLATDMKERRGRIIPADEPAGYVDAFAIELRGMARLLETASRSMTVAEAKRAASRLPGPGTMEKARRNAVNALYVMVNPIAVRNGVDPYEGMKGEGVNV